MIPILEYIMQHYALFLGGAILILLAIIGYYADKTNFGQGKSVENKDDNKKITDLKNLRLSDVTKNNSDFKTDEDSQMQVSNQEISQSINNDKQVDLKESLTNDDVYEQNQNLIENTTTDLNNVNVVIENQNIDNKHIDNIEDIQDDINNSEKIVNMDEPKNNEILLNNKEFEKFDDEFNSILPKKELISSDLLSDIDDLELGKTQKFSFNDMPDLDDIELPKIKSSVMDNEDIWKF